MQLLSGAVMERRTSLKVRFKLNSYIFWSSRLDSFSPLPEASCADIFLRFCQGQNSSVLDWSQVCYLLHDRNGDTPLFVILIHILTFPTLLVHLWSPLYDCLKKHDYLNIWMFSTSTLNSYECPSLLIPRTFQDVLEHSYVASEENRA